MGKALYRKHRPKTLAEVVGQEHITDTLTNALQNNRISHAYLFTGPKGVGKTSVARILAHQINKLPYTDDSSHLDIVEIDAASNNGVEDIRALRERVAVAPIEAKYKVYIIDEVHMLSKPAFNALLKTLEEPPAHVVFILATTETHKLPETIISRTQRFGFKPVKRMQVIEHLKKITSLEEINIDEKALQLIADHGMGSFRDSISLLDQISNTKGAVTASIVRQSLGQAPEDSINNILAAIANHEIATVAREINTLRKYGTQPSQFSKQLSNRLRNDIVKETNTINTTDALALLAQLIEIPAAYDPEIALELALYGATLVDEPAKRTGNNHYTSNIAEEYTQDASINLSDPGKDKSSQQITDAITLTAKPTKAESISSSSELQNKPDNISTKSKINQKMSQNATMSKNNTLTQEQWQEVLNTLKGNHNTLYGITRMGIPEFEPGIITLKFKFAFHQKRLNEEKTRHLLNQTILDVVGQNYQLNAVRAKSETPSTTIPDSDVADNTSNGNEIEEKPDITSISNIFGGAEIVK